MNTPIDQQEVVQGLQNLDLVYKAAMASQPSGLVPAALQVQQQAVNDAAQGLADLLQRLVEPAVVAQTSEEGKPSEAPKKK